VSVLTIYTAGAGCRSLPKHKNARSLFDELDSAFWERGHAAGQTIPQFHFHVIPRYTGDVPDPCGGIRHVIPEKAPY
jgi:diadenosine tetraphosphate (Ap4A) HIT family hydrolase